MQRHGWRIIPVNPHADQILGEPVYRTLADVPEQVGLVDVFRPPEQTPDIARQAVAAGATALWLQLGIASAEARGIARTPGCFTWKTAAWSSSSAASGWKRPAGSASGQACARRGAGW